MRSPERRELDELRARRVRLRKQIANLALPFTDVGYDQVERSRRLDWLVTTLRGTEPEWRRLHYVLGIERRLDQKPVRLR